jgi:hypothetical protein
MQICIFKDWRHPTEWRISKRRHAYSRALGIRRQAQKAAGRGGRGGRAGGRLGAVGKREVEGAAVALAPQLHVAARICDLPMQRGR